MVVFMVVHNTRVTDLLTYRDCAVMVVFMVVHSTRVTDLLTYRDCAVMVVFMVVHSTRVTDLQRLCCGGDLSGCPQYQGH